jgi:Na+-translocating ferredoxin:NAD+ oxidoreductase subunit E
MKLLNIIMQILREKEVCSMSEILERLKRGIITENTLFVQVLATCPTLAVTSTVNNAIGLGIATTVVLIFSNIFISLLRKFIPSKIRIPAFIVVIAGFVTIIDMIMHAYVPGLYKTLGIFIPLIVVNCVILGRAEAYASQNPVVPSIFDGLGMGLGFSLALIMVAIIREILGAGTLLGIQVMPQAYQPAAIMVLAPGAFFTFGMIMAVINGVQIAKSKKANSSSSALSSGNIAENNQ